MKLLLSMLIVLCAINAQAKNFYISATGNDANTGLSAATPWKTISKLNASFSSVVAGDSILFKKGEIFYGVVIVTKSGTSSLPITISSYGVGNKPLISGFTTATGWTNMGGNIWASTVTAGNKPNMVTIGGVATAMGRFPNSGYSTFESSVGNTSITDNELSASPNWTGGEVIIRKYHWAISRDMITNHSGGTITYTGTSGHNSTNGYGYFIQNHLSTLDKQNEWYFNNTTKVLSVYSTTTPNNVKVSTKDTLLSIGRYSYITVSGLSFEGANNAGVLVYNVAAATSNNKILDCDFNFTGRDGIYASNTDYLTVDNCTLNNSYNNGILVENEGGLSDYAKITNNKVKNSGMVAGMSYAGIANQGITVFGTNSLIQYNQVDSCGYVGISFYYTGSKVKNNLVNYFCSVKDDGSGIYTFGAAYTCGTGREVKDNIVLNGVGAGAGTSSGGSSAHGIYMDDATVEVEISGNSIANMTHSGMYLHNSQNLSVSKNTVYNSSITSMLLVHDTYASLFPLRNVNIKSNEFCAKTGQRQYTVRSIKNDVNDIGPRDSNKYVYQTLNTFKSDVTGASPVNATTLAAWKVVYPLKDVNATDLQQTTSRFEYNASKSPVTVSLGAKYKDVAGNSYNGSITLQPYTSKILLYVGEIAVNVPPVANAGSDASITLPTNNTTLTGSGTDAGGTISSYAWSKISGPASGTIVSANAATTVINNLVQGTYQYQLTVTDNNGAIAKDTVQVIVNKAVNQFPVASAGADQMITSPESSVTITGSGNDTDGNIVSFKWVKMSGPASGTIVSSNAATSLVSNLVQGIYEFELTVTDNDGAIAKDVIQVIVNEAANKLPIADAGVDQMITLPENSVTLAGSGNDTDGTIGSFSWLKISGPTSGTIVSSNTATSLVSNLVQGIYEFELTVTDNNGAIARDIIQVIVNKAANKLPVADAGADQMITLPENSVTLAGSGNDTDGTIVSFKWVKMSGPTSGTIVSSNAATSLISNLVQGIYEFELTVIDNDGSIAIDIIQVVVNKAANKLPVAGAGTDQMITLPVNSITLAGSGNDTDGTIGSYKWVKISGPTSGAIVSSNAATTLVSNLVEGIYGFQLTVTDNDGGLAKDTITVIVDKAVNKLPRANAGVDQTLTLPTNSAILNGSGTDEGGSIVSYAWSKIAGPTSTIVTPSAANTIIKNLKAGTYKFRLTVTDNEGAIARDTIQVTVQPAPNKVPVVDAGNNVSITLPENTAILSGNGTDPDGTISTFIWVKISGPDAGNIINPGAATSQVTDLVQGLYEFEFTVTDNNGTKVSDTIQLTVNDALNQAPVAVAGTSQAITLPLNSVTLSGSAADTDGTISNFKWVKTSGPGEVSIISSEAATTQVENLVEGIYTFELTVTDDDGAIAKDAVQVTVNAALNLLPTANAGNDVSITLPVNSSTISGAGTDHDGTIVTYEWLKISGPESALIANAFSASTTINNLIEGMYEFELTVGDNAGAFTKDTIKITVNKADNILPNANAGIDQEITLPLNSVVLDGTSIDTDGSITEYAWLQISGPSIALILDADNAVARVNNLLAGIYEFELIVTDNDGARSTDNIKVVVNAAINHVPLADAGQDETIGLPVNSITLSGTGIDEDGIVGSYAWIKISGPTTGTIASPTSATTSINELSAGSYEFELTVTDDQGATAKDTVRITVNVVENKAPQANAGDAQVIGLPTNTTTLSGAGVDVDGTISGYNWIKLSGPVAGAISTPASAVTAVMDLVKGIYEFELTITDNNGAVSRDTVIITVNPASNQAPVAEAGANQTITLPENTANLTGIAIDADGKIANVAWSKIYGPAAGSIETFNNVNTIISNLQQGLYEFELSVTDNEGLASKDTVQVTVNEALNQAPVATAGPSQSIMLPTSSITLYGNATDADGVISYYQWIKIAGPAATIASPNAASTLVENMLEGIYSFELTVTDDDGAIAKDIVQVTVKKAANKAPTANAGANKLITLPINTALLEGSATDEDGIIAKINWRKISGPTATIATPNSATTNINYLKVGIYKYQIIVTDNEGATARDTVQITVIAALNEAPTVNAGTDQSITLPGNETILSGSGTDVDGTINNYAWVKISGPAGSDIASPNAATTIINKLEEGVYQYQLTVTDDDGAIATDSITVTVNAAPNQAPFAYAGNDLEITLPTDSTTLLGEGFDGDGTISNYGWEKISGPIPGNIAQSDSAITGINNLKTGAYTFELTVTDDKGAVAKDTVKVTINPTPNQAPVADAGANQSITLPVNTINLTGTAADADGTIITTTWVEISGPSAGNIANPNNLNTTISNLQQGLYEYELNVTDNEGAVSKDTVQVTVNDALNQAPVAIAGVSQSITLPTNIITLSGSATDTDGSISSYEWVKTAGPTSGSITSPNTATTLVENMIEGIYTFELTVTDDDGAISKDAVQVIVNKAANKAPTANAGNDKVITLPTNSTNLNGGGTDEDGTIVQFNWRRISGTSGDIVSPDSANTNIENLTEGIFSYQLTVTDSDGASSRDTVQIIVETAPNQSPVSEAGAEQTMTLPVNSTILYGIGTDPEGMIAGYSWSKIAGPVQGNIASPNSATTNINNLVQGVYQYELIVSDNHGVESKDTVKVTVLKAANQAPMAYAGSNKEITLPVAQTMLEGEGADVDGVITQFTWIKISGPTNGTIVSPNSVTSIINNLVKGIYQFQLTITDNEGLIAKDTVEIKVNAAPNKAPLANAGNDQTITLPVNTITLTGSGTDVDGTINIYQWTNISGPSTAVIANPTSAVTVVKNLVAGVYQFELSITDDQGAISIAIVQVTVNKAPNKAPVSNAGSNKTITLPTNSIILSGNGTDLDGSIAGLEWLQISGPSAGTIVSPNADKTLVNELLKGIYQFQLTVTDNEGAIARDTVTVTVNKAPNMAPVAKAGDDMILTLPNNNATLAGVGADHDGTIVGYTWTKIAGPANGATTSPNSATTSISNLLQGVYQYQLVVKDNEGAVAKDTVKVTVLAAANVLPVAYADNDQTITLPLDHVTLNGTGTDSDGSISSYVWKKISGPAAGEISTPNSATTSLNNLAQGIYQYELTVKDNNGAVSKDTVKVTVNKAVNEAPTAYAGSDKTITLPVNSVSLNGNGLDNDGTISSYSWVKVSGPATATIVTANAAATVINNLVQGIYQFQLTVKDNEGAISKDTIMITVNKAINKLPSANAGSDKSITLPVNTVSLTGSGSDSDGTISSYAWAKISGPSSATIVTTNAAATVINNLVQGLYQFQLTVKDNEGAISKDTIKVTVNKAINKLPSANAGSDKSITLPLNSVSLTGSGTDTDGSISSYTWVKVSGPVNATIVTANASTTVINNLAEGIYQFQLTVKDNEGAIAKDTVKVTVNKAINTPPTANAGPDKTITLPVNSVSLIGIGTDISGAISSYTWAKISGPASSIIVSANAASTLINNLVQGVYQFQLTVKDNDGAVAKDTVMVFVNLKANQLPVANAGSNKTITLPANATILTGIGMDPDGALKSVTWRKISGTGGVIVSPATSITSVTNLAEGTYQFEFAVADSSNAIAKDTVQVTVKPAVAINKTPKANAGADIDIILPLNNVGLKGSGSDEDGTIVSYQWKVIAGGSGYSIVNAASKETSINNLFQGVYDLELTVTDNAGAKSKDTMKITVSSPRITNYTADEFKVYPNPVRDIANLDITTINANTQVSIIVTNLYGKQVSSKQFTSQTNETNYKLDMSTLSNGFYIISIRFDNGQVKSTKIIKNGTK